MQRAAQSLENANPLEANKQQEAAADQLRRLRQNLEAQSKNVNGGGGKEQTRSGRASERVEIPAIRSKAESTSAT